MNFKEKSELLFCYVPGLFVFLVLILFQMNGYEYDLLWSSEA